MSARVANRRIRLLLLLFLVAFAATLARAFWLQAVRAEALAGMADRQHRETVVVPAGRGAIRDRTGLELAIGERATTIYANPREVRDPRGVSLAVARALDLDPNELYITLSDRRRGFVYVERKADPEKAAELEKLEFPGLGFYPEERRSYPQGPVAAQVLGYAGTDNRGLAGLEYGLDRRLAGTPGKRTLIKDPTGRTIDVVSVEPERDGEDVQLTLDHTIQATAERVLRDTVRRWGAKDATAVVLDPRSGEVLAMAVEPGFDANRFPQTPQELQKNRAVTDTYEPGSTFKLVTVGAVLSERLVGPRTPFTLPYQIRVADRKIHDAEKRGTERLTVSEILSHSSNVGAVKLALLLGKARLAKWITRFGFGMPTGIDFPDESPGIALPPERWSGSTIGNVPIGQGIAVTPIQMAAAYAAVANRGLWTQPRLVMKIGKERTEPPLRKRIVSRTVAAHLTRMLRGVVDEGTGRAAAIAGYEVAGKTGTAQKPGPNGYNTGRYVASFVGIVPAQAPRLVVLVTVDEPRGSIFGGEVAAPAFAEIARFALQYLEVPPDARPANADTSG